MNLEEITFTFNKLLDKIYEIDDESFVRLLIRTCDGDYILHKMVYSPLELNTWIRERQRASERKTAEF